MPDSIGSATVRHDAFEDYTLNLYRESHNRRVLYVWRTGQRNSVAFGRTVAAANEALERAYMHPGERGPRLIGYSLS